jgi:hypothetical protein
MKIVKFLKTAGRYNAGQIAGFDDDLAATMIAQGTVVLHGDGRPTDDASPAAVANPQVSENPAPQPAAPAAPASAPVVTNETVVIPAEAELDAMDKLSLIELAKKIAPNAKPSTKTDAMAIIKTELERRAANT